MIVDIYLLVVLALVDVLVNGKVYTTIAIVIWESNTEENYV